MLVALIEKLRKEKGFSQQQMADFLGISRRHYQRLEYGKSSMSVDVLEKCCEKFGMKVLIVDKALLG